MPALTDFDIPALQESLRRHDIPAVHARKLLRRFYNGGGDGIDGIEIPRTLHQLLHEQIPLRQSSIVARQLASDGTLKLLIAFNPPSPAHHNVECVLMPSHRPDRAAGCISSQVGCAMGCDFCASTRTGVERNLSAGEIVEQFLHLRHASLELRRRLVTIVFMGMGEPLLNYENVIDAIHRIAGDDLGALGWRQITLSTVGIAPGIDRLADEGLGIQLAVSLHAPDDQTRSRIVPTSRKYPVRQIVDSAIRYQHITGRIVNVEYCLLSQINDSDDQAHLLGQLLAGLRMHVNLIPYNPIGPGVSGQTYQAPSPERMKRFARILGQHNVVAHFRLTRGQDIDGACGQLKSRLSEHIRNNSPPITF